MSDFIKSDYCNECGGQGFIYLRHEQGDNDTDQCEECERLVEVERRADIQHDIAKGN